MRGDSMTEGERLLHQKKLLANAIEAVSLDRASILSPLDLATLASAARYVRTGDPFPPRTPEQLAADAEAVAQHKMACGVNPAKMRFG